VHGRAADSQVVRQHRGMTVIMNKRIRKRICFGKQGMRPLRVMFASGNPAVFFERIEDENTEFRNDGVANLYRTAFVFDNQVIEYAVDFRIEKDPPGQFRFEFTHQFFEMCTVTHTSPPPRLKYSH
jgi:hypothetical protein